jgi:ABC-type uncharacterized transport system ATPase subunit
MSKDVTKITAASEHTTETGVLAIEVKDLCKSFKDFRVVDHLSLSVKQGEIFGLLLIKNWNIFTSPGDS